MQNKYKFVLYFPEKSVPL